MLGVLTAIAMAGCNSGAPPGPASATSSARVALKITGGQVAFPTVGGYGAVFRYSPNDLSATTMVDLATSSAPMLTVPGGAQPPGVQLAAFRFTLGTRITFEHWYRLPTIVSIPAPAGGRSFAIYGYDLTTGVGTGINPGNAAGTTITFSAALGPVTLLPHEYLFVLIEQ